MLKNLTLRTGLLILLALMTVLLLLVSGVGNLAINKGKYSLEVINRIQGDELNSLHQSNSSMLRARTTAAVAIHQMEMGLLDEATQSSKLVDNYVAESRSHLRQFVASGTVTAQGKKLADNVVAAWESYYQQGIKPMQTALNKQYADEYYTLLENNLSSLGLAFAEATQAFSVFADQVSQRQLEQAARSEQLMKWLMGLCLLTAIVLVVLAWQVLRRRLLAPLGQAISHLEYIASGDLTQPLPPVTRNELGRLNQAMGVMQDALQGSVNRVRDASLQIDVGSRELAAGNVDLAQRTEESAASLEQTAASMEQLTSTVRLNASNAQQAHELARQVSDTADRGAEVVCYVMEKMGEISSSSKRIGDILSVIDGIAFQTNILALNASVEAARAGEQGRGFAVVATEVRHLAQRSASAAKEIRLLITESQSRVSEGSEMATKAGETMDEISGEVMRVTALMKEISVASSEQRRGIEQVNLAVTQMDEVAQQNAALVEQATAATRSLEAQSQQLQQTMAVFKLTTV